MTSHTHIIVCLIVAFAVLAHTASIADEQITSEEANQFLSRAKRSLWEECYGEGCDAHEVWEYFFGVMAKTTDGKLKVQANKRPTGEKKSITKLPLKNSLDRTG